MATPDGARAPTEFTFGDHQYRILKLSAMKQLHLSRKIAPLIPPLAPVLAKVSTSRDDRQGLVDMVQLMGPFAEGLAELSDEISEYVVNICMDAVQREVSHNVWMRVWSADSTSQFPELNDLGNVLQLVAKVIWDALGPFIQGLLTDQPSVTPAKTPEL
jgi:hypothetical protein